MRRERRHALVPMIAEVGLGRATVPFLFVQTMHPGTIRLAGDTAVGRAYIAEAGLMRDGSSHLNGS
ncbi:hypothetical protein ACFV7R_27725 [Streptomyces sp. NPDC059866]|uniref:hypothetical protein n=1 Tax=Streptomyces sp. NPDC059866 TaxID=3346978 RepID=UPI00365B3F53